MTLVLLNGKIHNMIDTDIHHNLNDDKLGDIVIHNNSIVEIRYNDDTKSRNDPINYYKNTYLIDYYKNTYGKDTKIVDLTYHDVYPGLIDAHCHHGVTPLHGNRYPDSNEFNGQDNHTLNITDNIDPDCPLIKSAKRNGIVAMCVCPGSGQLFGGFCSIIKPIPNTYFINDIVIDDSHIIKCALGENPLIRNSENTQMKLAKIFRDKLNNPPDEVFEKIKNGDITLKIHCHSIQSISLAIRLIEEFNLKATLDHCTDASFVAKKIKELNIPVITGPLLGTRSKAETKNKHFSNLSDLYLKNIKFALSTDTITYTTQDLRLTAILACSEGGISKYAALRAITAVPAEILGLDDYGTIEIGKSGNLVITQGDIMDIYNRIRYVCIDGELDF